MKFLIDECLKPDLVSFAHDAGFVAISVRDLGKCGSKDWKIVPYVIDNDYILVTHNSKDFRDSKGKQGYLTKESLHPGLICLNSANSAMTPDLQAALFGTALEFLSNNGIHDLMNQVIEVDFLGDYVDIRHYEAPRESGYTAPAKSSNG